MKITKEMRFVLVLIVWGIFLSLAVSAEKILMIGDSHTAGDYGNNLQSLLQPGNNVIKEAVPGINIYGWISGSFNRQTFSNLQSLINQHQPNKVIITLGTNDYLDSEQTITSQAQRLITAIHSETCFWVGPPKVRDSPPPPPPPNSRSITNADVDKIYNALTSALAGTTCQLIDSRAYTNPQGTTDGIHFENNNAIIWANGVYAQITGQAAPATVIARRGGASATAIGTPTTGTTPTGTTSSCTDQQQCREIDEVWQRRLGFFIRNPNEVWDVAASRWQNFNVMYPTTGTGTYLSGERPTGVCTASGGTSEQKALLDTIAWAEGTGGVYNIVVGGVLVEDPEHRYDHDGQMNIFNGFQSHPRIKIKVTGTGNCGTAGTLCSDAAGRYQFMFTVYDDLKKRGFFNNFEPEEQDRAALQLIADRGVTPQILDIAISTHDFVPLWGKLAPVWASLPCNTPNVVLNGITHCTEIGKSFYGQSVKPSQQLQQQFEKCLQGQQSRAS